MEKPKFPERIFVRITAKTKDRITATAQRLNESESDLIRLLLDAGLATLSNTRARIVYDQLSESEAADVQP